MKRGREEERKRGREEERKRGREEDRERCILTWVKPLNALTPDR